MKIVSVDNYNRAHIADELIADNISDAKIGEFLVGVLNSKVGNSEKFFRLVDDSYRLSKGMDDLI